MTDVPEAANWAVTEFADADLGDLRRTQRLIQLAHALAQNPGAALPEACGSSAMLKAAYRFFDNADIEPPDIIQSHIEATYSRLTHVPVVLAVQDTTEADWTSLRATEGLSFPPADFISSQHDQRSVGLECLFRRKPQRAVR